MIKFYIQFFVYALFSFFALEIGASQKNQKNLTLDQKVECYLSGEIDDLIPTNKNQIKGMQNLPVIVQREILTLQEKGKAINLSNLATIPQIYKTHTKKNFKKFKKILLSTVEEEWQEKNREIYKILESYNIIGKETKRCGITYKSWLELQNKDQVLEKLQKKNIEKKDTEETLNIVLDTVKTLNIQQTQNTEPQNINTGMIVKNFDDLYDLNIQGTKDPEKKEIHFTIAEVQNPNVSEKVKNSDTDAKRNSSGMATKQAVIIGSGSAALIIAALLSYGVATKHPKAKLVLKKFLSPSLLHKIGMSR